ALNSALALARRVRPLGRIIERSSMESPYSRKRKTRHRRVILNMVPDSESTFIYNSFKFNDYF
ncbi:hypothetical protein LDY77_24535, partial [Serratia marcescens]|uniref:hypothetical protein n=1 Tax=Serratia marcescens TaxID=615 RepID=UPI001CDC68CA